MGYTTNFNGSFVLDKPLTIEHANYLREFSNSRRMKRNPVIAADLPDPIRETAGIKDVGEYAEYFVGEDDESDQYVSGGDNSVMDYNSPSPTQPGLWCDWAPTDDNKGIEWNGAEKFYHYIEWLEYIIKHFIKPWGYSLDGEVTWVGEDTSDRGRIVVDNNEVKTFYI